MLLADGYFDKKAIGSRSSTEGTAFSVGSGNNIAYGGFLVYNLNTLASVFLPQAGYRNTYGRLTLPGIAGYYWSATAAQQGSVIKPYFLDAAQDNSSASQISVSMGWGNSQNEGYCISRRRGRIEVIFGSMFSGKTEELIRRLKSSNFARQRC